MKSLTIALILAVTTATARAADTPAAILADYQEKAQPAVERVNIVLEKFVVPIIASLVKAGDTAGAETLKQQLKAKQDGQPVAAPHPQATAVFKNYDTARAKAIEPAQKSAIARIDAVLSSSDGKKLEVVSELGKVRAQIESGGVTTVDPLFATSSQWAFQRGLTGGVTGTFLLNADGTTEMRGGGSNRGTWKPGEKPATMTVEWANPKDTWTVLFQSGNTFAEVHSTVWSDTRYLKLLPPTAAPTK